MFSFLAAVVDRRYLVSSDQTPSILLFPPIMFVTYPIIHLLTQARSKPVSVTTLNCSVVFFAPLSKSVDGACILLIRLAHKNGSGHNRVPLFSLLSNIFLVHSDRHRA
jgi:hypothetical protein